MGKIVTTGMTRVRQNGDWRIGEVAIDYLAQTFTISSFFDVAGWLLNFENGCDLTIDYSEHGNPTHLGELLVELLNCKLLSCVTPRMTAYYPPAECVVVTAVVKGILRIPERL